MSNCILVVDDNQLIRKLVAAMLTEKGFEVVEAEDGSAALREFRNHHPKLIVTDYFMPNLDGADLIKAIRSGAYGTPDLPIIALAGSRFAEERMNDAGADRYIPKPLHEEQLLSAVESLLGVTDGSR